MIKLSNAVFAIDATGTCPFLKHLTSIVKEANLPILVSWKLAKMVPAIEDAAKSFYQLRDALIRKYGTEGVGTGNGNGNGNGNGVTVILSSGTEGYDKKKASAFVKEFNALTAQETDLPFEVLVVTLKDLGKTGNLSAEAMIVLEPILTIKEK